MQREAGLVLIIVAIPLAVFGGFGLLGGPRQVGLEAAAAPEPEERFPADMDQRIPAGMRGIHVRGFFQPEGDFGPGTRVDVLQLIPDPTIAGLRRSEVVVADALVIGVVRKKNDLPQVALAMSLDEALKLHPIKSQGPVELVVRKEAKPSE